MNTRESLIAWSDEYSLGLPEIDEQHKVLFAVLNKLWISIVNRGSREEQLVILDELERYTVSHFTAEEVFMRATNYADFEEHKKAHKAFVDRLAQEKRNVLAGGSLSLDLLKVLKDWLADHILVTDKAYAKAHQQKQGAQTTLGRFFKRLLG